MCWTVVKLGSSSSGQSMFQQIDKIQNYYKQINQLAHFGDATNDFLVLFFDRRHWH